MTGEKATRRADALALIRERIEQRGQHGYVVAAGTAPRSAYTIGSTEAIGTELVPAGGATFCDDDVVEVLNDIADALRADPALRKVMVNGAGTFTLQPADSCAQDLLLGARNC